MNKILFWLILVLLIALNFALQNFDFTQWQNHSSAMYQYNAKNLSWPAFALNKAIRFGLNLCCFYVIQQKFYPQNKKSFWILSSLLFLAAIAALYLNFNQQIMDVNSTQTPIQETTIPQPSTPQPSIPQPSTPQNPALQNLYSMLHKVAFSPLITLILIAMLFTTNTRKN